jgi:hypothetical protein
VADETIALWSSADALVLKVLTLLIQDVLKPYLSWNCYHLKGHGELKKAVGEVMKNYTRFGFFVKTDVTSYYDSIDHHTLMMKIYELPVNLIWSHLQAICYVQWQNVERARIQVGSKCKVFRHFSKSTKYSIDTLPYGASGNLSNQNRRKVLHIHTRPQTSSCIEINGFRLWLYFCNSKF